MPRGLPKIEVRWALMVHGLFTHSAVTAGNVCQVQSEDFLEKITGNESKVHGNTVNALFLISLTHIEKKYKNF